MTTINTNLESQIIDSVFNMNRDQQIDVLDYLGKVTEINISKEKYRREAMKQIREALNNFG